MTRLPACAGQRDWAHCVLDCSNRYSGGHAVPVKAAQQWHICAAKLSCCSQAEAAMGRLSMRACMKHLSCQLSSTSLRSAPVCLQPPLRQARHGGHVHRVHGRTAHGALGLRGEQRGKGAGARGQAAAGALRPALRAHALACARARQPASPLTPGMAARRERPPDQASGAEAPSCPHARAVRRLHAPRADSDEHVHSGVKTRDPAAA